MMSDIAERRLTIADKILETQQNKRRADIERKREERQSSQMSQLTEPESSQGTVYSMGSTYSRGTFGRGDHKYIRSRKYTKKSYHKKMPKRSYKRKSSRSSRKSSNPYYYDRVLGQKVVKPSVGRRWTKILADEESNVWKEYYDPVNTVEDAAKLPFGLDSRSATDEQLLMRKQRGYRGSGSYSVGKMWRKSGLGKTMARAGRSMINAGVNKALGAMSGMGLYGGQGLYNDNALIDGGAMPMAVMGNHDETETITITNCESIKDIYAPTIAAGSSGYSAETIQVNPGLFNFSRKLSAIAKNYVQYEIKQLVFEIRPLISESNVNNGITGTLMAAPLYDPLQETPDNKDDMLDISGAVSGRIIDHMRVGVECDPRKTKDCEYFVRTGPVPTGRDVDEYDHCKFVVATNNIPATFSNLAIAELYVYYTIELRMWRNNRDILRDLYVCSVDTTEANTPQTIFNSIAKAQLSNIGTSLDSTGSGVWKITFPADFSGNVEIKLSLEGTSLTRANAAVTYGINSNVSAITDLYGVGVAGDAPAATGGIASTTGLIVTTHARVRSVTGGVDNTLTITVSGGAGTGTVSQWELDIQEYSSQFFQSRSNPVPVFVNYATGAVTQV